jgi:hypothetical protein
MIKDHGSATLERTRSCKISQTADRLLLEARAAKVAKDALAYKAACEAWLLQDRGIHVGDTVTLHYSGEVREILVETFELHWPKGHPVEIPTLVFEGPTVQANPRRVERASNWCSRRMHVSREPRRSRFLLRRLPTLPVLAAT